MPKETIERRRRERVPVRLAVTIRLESREIPVETHNLSLKGLACSSDPRLRKNGCCQVVIRLAPDLQSIIKGRVVRAAEAEAAIDFLGMDLESFAHLRKIIEYHSLTPETVSRELLALAFPISRPPAYFSSKNRRLP